jgi:hypothetical protein
MFKVLRATFQSSGGPFVTSVLKGAQISHLKDHNDVLLAPKMGGPQQSSSRCRLAMLPNLSVLSIGSKSRVCVPCGVNTQGLEPHQFVKDQCEVCLEPLTDDGTLPDYMALSTEAHDLISNALVPNYGVYCENGHAFHWVCIAGLLHTGQQCPACRLPKLDTLETTFAQLPQQVYETFVDTLNDRNPAVPMRMPPPTLWRELNVWVQRGLNNSYVDNLTLVEAGTGKSHQVALRWGSEALNTNVYTFAITDRHGTAFYDGRGGPEEEHLVVLVNPSFGQQVFFQGGHLNERAVRSIYEDGQVNYLEGRKGQEQVVRSVWPTGQEWHWSQEGLERVVYEDGWNDLDEVEVYMHSELRTYGGPSGARYKMRSSSRFKQDEYTGRIPGHERLIGRRLKNGEHHTYRGNKGKEFLVAIEYYNGDKAFYKGTQNSERKTTLVKSNGDRLFYSGPRREERLRMKEETRVDGVYTSYYEGPAGREYLTRVARPQGDVEYYEGPPGSEYMTRVVLPNGDVEIYHVRQKGYERLVRLERDGLIILQYDGPSGEEQPVVDGPLSAAVWKSMSVAEKLAYERKEQQRNAAIRDHEQRKIQRQGKRSKRPVM